MKLKTLIRSFAEKLNGNTKNKTSVNDDSVSIIYEVVPPKRRLSRKAKRWFLCYAFAVLLVVVVLACHAFATDDPLTVINNLSDFIFSLIRAVGLILLGWGIVQVGLSLQSHDPSQRSNGFLTLAGGIVITFTKEILTLITG